MAFYVKPTNLQEKIQEDIVRLKKYLQINTFPEFCAVFDIGTKGVRVIVGPKLNLTEFKTWDPDESDIFFIAALDAQLGIEFEKNHGNLDKATSIPFANTILFINAIRKLLHFIPNENFALVGTAVFRWLDNRLEVLEQIKLSTGLPEVEILTEPEEAYYSLLAITYTHDKIASKKFPKINFESNDIILLFDQGGGSTEVSYIYPTKPENTELNSMYHTGTVKLEKKFFLKYRLQKFEAHTFKATIEESLHGVREYIEGHIDALHGFEKIIPSRFDSPKKTNIYAFGMGTAIKVCFEQYYGDLLQRKISGKKFRGWKLTIPEMESIYKKTQNELISKYVTVEALDNNKPRNDSRPADDLKAKLQMLYALSTYQLLLKKFQVTSISYAYYNLKYGVYLQKFVKGVSKFYSPPKEKYFQKNKDEIRSVNERINILSGIGTGSKEASYFHQFSLDNLVYIFGNRLSNPVKEKSINDGRKRIDIVFDNTASTGFFARLISHYNVFCPKIIVECKNDSDLRRNPAFDQIVGRLNPKRGEFGILVCRFIVNNKKVIDTCKDIMNDTKGRVLVLDDIAIKTLLKMREFNREQEIDQFMSEKFDELIM